MGISQDHALEGKISYGLFRGKNRLELKENPVKKLSLPTS
jgi:hypothetical protein